MSETKTYEAGEIIFSQDSSCDGVYLVTSGLVMIYRSLENSGDSKDVELAMLGQGGMFGEMALLEHQERSASAKALRKTDVVLLTRAEFEAQLQSLPTWATLLMRRFAGRLRETNQKLMEALEDQDEAQRLPEDEGLFVIDAGSGSEQVLEDLGIAKK